MSGSRAKEKHIGIFLIVRPVKEPGLITRSHGGLPGKRELAYITLFRLSLRL